MFTFTLIVTLASAVLGVYFANKAIQLGRSQRYWDSARKRIIGGGLA